MNPEGYNYNPLATIDDGTCTVLDCDYDGEMVVEFEKQNYADWNDVANRDVITPTCEITRQNNQPLFNYVYQTSYYDNQDADCNIEWKQGSYDQPGAWYNGLHNAMGGSLGYQINNYGNNVATLHIIDSDLYFEFEFTFWQNNNNGGGFAYTRTWILPEDCEEVLAIYGCTDATACNYDEIAVIDDGTCDLVTCVDDCGVNYGDNSTCTDCDGVLNGNNWDCADDCGIAYGDNSSCSGCTYPDASNYDPTATIEDGTCTVPDCSVLVDGEVVLGTTFNYSGSIETYTVPEGVYALYVEVYGASGGNSDGSQGGLGAMMSGQIEVTPGQQLQILAGQKAPDVNGASGGGGGSYVVTSDGIPLMLSLIHI